MPSLSLPCQQDILKQKGQFSNQVQDGVELLYLVGHSMGFWTALRSLHRINYPDAFNSQTHSVVRERYHWNGDRSKVAS